MINPVAAACTVTPYNLMYDGSEHTAAFECTGLAGELLTGTLDGTTHTESSYSDIWTFTESSGSYIASGGPINDIITLAPSTTTVDCPTTVLWTGFPLTPCTATVTGAGGLNQDNPIDYYFNTDVGIATADSTYAGDLNHTGSFGTNVFTINKSVVCTITPYTVDYDGLAHTATGECTSPTGDVSAGLDLEISTNHTDPGVYTDTWTFTDPSGEGYDPISGQVTNTINKADASCSIEGWSGTYDGSPHGASGTCTGLWGRSWLPDRLRAYLYKWTRRQRQLVLHRWGWILQ